MKQGRRGSLAGEAGHRGHAFEGHLLPSCSPSALCLLAARKQDLLRHAFGHDVPSAQPRAAEQRFPEENLSGKVSRPLRLLPSLCPQQRTPTPGAAAARGRRSWNFVSLQGKRQILVKFFPIHETNGYSSQLGLSIKN